MQRKEREKEQVNQQEYIFVQAKGSLHKIELSDIVCLQSKGDFSLMITRTDSYIVDVTLKDAYEVYGDKFVRCHKSYVVNIDNVVSIMGNLIKTSKGDFPIGRAYKESLMKRLLR